MGKVISHLILSVRDVDDAHEDVLVFLQPVGLEEPDHQLGNQRDGDEGQNHGNSTEWEQLSSKWPSVLQRCLFNLKIKSSYNLSSKSCQSQSQSLTSSGVGSWKPGK